MNTLTSFINRVVKSHQSQKRLKVLFIGPRGSGKSTIVRKLQLRMGYGISAHEKASLRDIAYIEFLHALIDKIERRACETRKSWASLNVLYEAKKHPPKDWSEKIREILQSYYEDVTLRRVIIGSLPDEGCSVRLASFCSNIFAVGWLPSDADFIQCYVPDYGLKETRLGRSISIFEASSSLTQYEEIESIARHMDIIVIVMAFSSPAASVLGHNETFWQSLRSFRGVLDLQKNRGGYLHLIVNEFDFQQKWHGVPLAGAQRWSAGCLIKDVSDSKKATVHKIHATDASWMQNILKAWDKIFPNRLVLT